MAALRLAPRPIPGLLRNRAPECPSSPAPSHSSHLAHLSSLSHLSNLSTVSNLSRAGLPQRLHLQGAEQRTRSRGAPARAPRAAAGDDVDAQMGQVLAQSRRPGGSSGSVTKVVLSGRFQEPLSREAVKALVGARGLELAGVLGSDPASSGQDVGQLVGMDQPLELPVMSDPVMLFAAIAQARNAPGVYVDLTGNPDAAFENVRQAVAFGLSCVVGHCDFSQKQLSTLLEFCEKASMGCLVAPTLSVGALLLEQAALSVAFHYGHVDVIESLPPSAPQGPSSLALDIANDLSQIGRTFNDGDVSSDDPSRGAVVGDGVRVHSMRHPGLMSSLSLQFAAPGQVLNLSLNCTDARAYMPGLLLAVRRAPRLKGLVYGLEKFL